jgi:hypothetical protein
VKAVRRLQYINTENHHHSKGERIVCCKKFHHKLGGTVTQWSNSTSKFIISVIDLKVTQPYEYIK